MKKLLLVVLFSLPLLEAPRADDTKMAPGDAMKGEMDHGDAKPEAKKKKDRKAKHEKKGADGTMKGDGMMKGDEHGGAMQGDHMDSGMKK